MTLELRGANQFVAVANALKEAGDKGLQRELNKALRESAKPFAEKVRENALEMLPNRGGLNQRVADQVVPRVRKSNSSRAQGVRLAATGRQGMKSIKNLDAGKLRHPVFARGDQSRDEWPWVPQTVTPGFWSKAAEEVGPQVTANAQAALDVVARKIDNAR